jgi:hypothetical protein
MEQDSAELERSTADDQWPLDHHLEELLGVLTVVARIREVDSDADDEPSE